jgi:putative Holliday junction resolvase
MATGARPILIHTSTATFREALPEGGVLLGLDPGTKTIGLALCDAGWRFASPTRTVTRRKFRDDKAEIAALIAERAVRGMVIGLPLNMDGSDSPRAQSARAMARNLGDLNLPIMMWDERWSTVAAERAMIAQDMSRARRAERIDAHAAALILQGAIDALSGALF